VDLTEKVCHCGDLVDDHKGMSHNHSPVVMERERKEDPTEKFDIMWYGQGGELGSRGLMTKEAAEVYARTLEARDRIIGWKAGTCQSVFQFWALGNKEAMELPHKEEPPTGRIAAIKWQKARKAKGLRDSAEE